MNLRLPTTKLEEVSTADISAAIERAIEGAHPPSFGDPTRFELLAGDRRFPPKVIFALALERSLGRPATSADFSGGETSAAFRILLSHGQEIVTKQRRVGSLDATFSVGRNTNTEFLIYESRGGTDRNTEYMLGLESLLMGLASMDATLTSVQVDSRSTRHLPAAKREVQLQDRQYPIALRYEENLDSLRRLITAAAARTARTTDNGTGGNPTKRLRINYSTQDAHTLMDTAGELSQQSPLQPISSKPISFEARAPSQSKLPSEKAPQEGTVVTHVHAAMQELLYDKLGAVHGTENVAAELRMASGNPADLVVRTAGGYDIYEIKTSLVPRECIRQAMGQLLEYGHWPNSFSVCRLIVVGPAELDTGTSEYLSILSSTYGLQIHYLCQPESLP